MQKLMGSGRPGFKAATRRAARPLAALGALAVVAALVVVASGAPLIGHAAQWVTNAGAGGAGEFQPDEPVANGQENVELIWSTNMEVGIASDEIRSYTGYAVDIFPPIGALDVAEFTRDDVRYDVRGIFVQQVGSYVQIVFYADVPIPGGWVFEADGVHYPLNDASKLGADRNIQAWRLDSNPAWEAGETISVSLFEETETGPKRQTLTDVKPEDFLLAVHYMAGDISRSGEFDTIVVTVEQGKRYVVEMKGADTGDGTLSDPWISGVNGRFEVDGKPRWEPVWYDASGRTDTSVTFSNGSTYRVDETGRMFAVSSGNGEEVVLMPVSGSNDDGGEGLNALLFLANFPPGEYRILVSGSQNPSDTGAYAFSLMEIISDDHTDNAESPGTLSLGGFAQGNIETPGDTDWFAVDVEGGKHYVVRAEGLSSTAGALSDVRFAGVYDEDGMLAPGTSNNHRPRRTSGVAMVAFTAETTGTYHVAVSGQTPYEPHRSIPPVGTYIVRISEEE